MHQEPTLEEEEDEEVRGKEKDRGVDEEWEKGKEDIIV